jgi:hypothetical protein
MHISDRELARLHFAIQGIEANHHDKESMALRKNIIRFYGIDWFRMREIKKATLEPVKRLPSIWDALPRNYVGPNEYQGGALSWWNSRDPWATGKEAYRRKDEQRRIMRGEFVPPWFNKGVSK